MTQPKNFGFGTEEQMLKAESRKFFTKNGGELKLMELVAGDHNPHSDPQCSWDQNAWEKMVALGWTALAVPERVGGVGMSSVGVAGLVEEAGRAALPSPLLTTVLASHVLACCRTDAADRVLGKILDGGTASLAVMDRNGSWIMPEECVSVDDSGSMSGIAWFVQDARKVDYFIVKAEFDKGAGLVAVPADATGLKIEPDHIVDRTHDQAHICLDGVVIPDEWIVFPPGCSGADIVTRAEPFIYTMISADMCGAGEWQLQATVEYAKNREQFGRPIGFFQAVKHPIVNMMLKIDDARSLVYNAACAIDHEPGLAQQYAHMAKSSADDMAEFTSDRSIQLHGGMGFTWEAFVQLYFKRQLHHRTLFGDGRYHREKLADILMGPLAEG